MILILADSYDAHADAVEKHLEAFGDVSKVRLNLDISSLEKTSITYDSESDSWQVASEKYCWNTKNIQAVWPRRLYVDSSSIDSNQEPKTDTVTTKMWIGEWTRTLFWVYQELEQASWLTPYRLAVRAENKYLQMNKAKAIGFDVPHTLLSNNRKEILKFAENCSEGIALKSLAQDFYYKGDKAYGLYVNRLKKKDLENFGDYEESPILLQEYIPKAFEVRITSIGNRHFACKIESQASAIASTDWRRYDILKTPHTVMEIPVEVSSKLTRLLRELGLEFGASDFIVSPDGKWHFLEVNPSGQWLWIEQLSGLSISYEVATALRKKCFSVPEATDQ
jgi:glutathione synthase/RimK-type ligase-like ATP-grasp enzyme